MPLMKELKPHVFPPGQVIVMEGKVSSGLHFIEQVVTFRHVTLRDTRSIRWLSDGPIALDYGALRLVTLRPRQGTIDVIQKMVKVSQLSDADFFGESSLLAMIDGNAASISEVRVTCYSIRVLSHACVITVTIATDCGHCYHCYLLALTVALTGTYRTHHLSEATFATVTYCDVLILSNASFASVLEKHGISKQDETLRSAVTDSATQRDKSRAASVFGGRRGTLSARKSESDSERKSCAWGEMSLANCCTTVE